MHYLANRTLENFVLEPGSNSPELVSLPWSKSINWIMFRYYFHSAQVVKELNSGTKKKLR